MAKIASAQKKESIGFGTANTASNQAQEIEALAYQFFVERGFAHGFDREDWARAEAIVKKRK